MDSEECLKEATPESTDSPGSTNPDGSLDEPSSFWMDVRREEQLLEKGLACPICMDFLAEPLLLDCGHAFCRLCLLQASHLSPAGRCCPSCRSTFQLDPTTHPADPWLSAKVLLLVPEEEVSLRLTSDQAAVQAIAERTDKRLPIFNMHGVASRVGQNFSLHLFEPRYRLMIQRVWHGNRRFLCAQEEPRDGDPALIVQVDAAFFRRDGRADVRGHGVQLTYLQNVGVEADTGGLFYADVDPPGAPSRRASSSTSIESQESAWGRHRPSNAEAHLMAVRYHQNAFEIALLAAMEEDSVAREGDRCVQVFFKSIRRCFEGLGRRFGRRRMRIHVRWSSESRRAELMPPVVLHS